MYLKINSYIDPPFICQFPLPLESSFVARFNCLRSIPTTRPHGFFGMVQANVGQKRLKRNILRRFF
jgi:hypothetical protein